MFVSLRIITLPTGRETDAAALVAQVQQAAATLAGVRSCWVAPVLPAVAMNAGHIVWRMTFATEREAIAAPMDAAWRERVAGLLDGTQVSHVGYHVTRRAARGGSGGIWRALVFRVMPQGFPQGAAALEDALLLMPDHVSTIRSWALSTVSVCDGPKAFTHVWEQEFDSLDGLTGEYMAHPVHWVLADAFFDAECPEYIVDPYLVQVAGAIDHPIITE